MFGTKMGLSTEFSSLWKLIRRVFCHFWMLAYQIWTENCSPEFTGNLHTQQYSNWNSNHPKSMLLGVLKGLIHTAHVICDRKEDLSEELELLKNVFLCNGYPELLVAKTLKESWARETLKAALKGIQQDVEAEKNGDYC